MLNKVSIAIRTFLRDAQLFYTIDAIRRNLPEVQMIICDCGDHNEEKEGIFADLQREGHVCIQLPFDAGFGSMGNAIADRLERPLLLMGSDDFDFSTVEVRQGIEKLIRTANLYPKFNVFSGRVNNNPYEFLLHDKGNGVLEEEACGIIPHPDFPQDYYWVDLTVNYSLVRKEVFQKVRWDDDVKIGGGEHAAWFLDVRQAGFAVAYIPGVNINEQQVRNSARYNLYRRRAMDPARPCFVKRGIRKYVMGNGVVDYEETGYGLNRHAC